MAEHEHHFDPLSGWCDGCTLRDDGRQTWHGDVSRTGPNYTPADLALFRERAHS
ncbi:hypothetical protein [Microbacterium rhizomatis]|uniref:hypothetical protein n=1 Tax=Microbacterium rhizomatis TaxID=1631477 RepID=UPI001478D96A|nr:hypothetical protein [Microbacterium rhizomatis]